MIITIPAGQIAAAGDMHGQRAWPDQNPALFDTLPSQMLSLFELCIRYLLHNMARTHPIRPGVSAQAIYLELNSFRKP